MPEWCTVRSFLFRHEAAVVACALQGHQIPCRIWADDLGGWRPDLAIGQGGVQVQVPREVAASADALLTELEAGAS